MFHVDSSLFFELLRYNSGKVRFFIRDLQLRCSNHAKVFIEADRITTVTDFSTLRSGLISLKFLTRVEVYDHLIDHCNVEEPFTIIRNCSKSLNRIKPHNINSTFDWMVRLLQEIPTLAEKCSWEIGNVDKVCLDEPVFLSCKLTPIGAEQLAFLLTHFRNTITLCLNLEGCHISSAATKLVESITHEQLQHLVLEKLIITANRAAALGRSLPKLTSLRLFKLTKLSSDEAVEVKLLFRLDKLEKLYLPFFYHWKELYNTDRKPSIFSQLVGIRTSGGESQWK